MSQLIIYLSIQTKYLFNQLFIKKHYLFKHILKILLKSIDIFENISEKIDINTF